MNKHFLNVLGCTACAFAVLIGTSSVAMADPQQLEADAVFTLDALHNGKVEIVNDGALQARKVQDSLLFTAEDTTGESAILDSALIKEGALAVAGDGFVDLSWDTASGTRTYQILRDDTVIGETNEQTFRDTRVTNGASYEYQIATLEPIDGTTIPEDEATIRGFEVYVPIEGEIAPQVEEQNRIIGARAANSNSTILYQTFIPQNRVNVPPAGCGSYGAGYTFAGNNRGFNAGVATSKTRLGVGLGWNAGTFNYLGEVEPTKVYNSAGKLVDTKTAGTGDIWAKQLSRTTTSADIRLSVKAGNPFCPVANSIQGALTMTVTKNGAYSVISGSHRQMPNHEIYVMGLATGAWKRVYTRSYASELCLISWACPTATISGSGTY